MIAYVGIGANLGDAQANVLDALARLARMDGSMLVHTSSMYRTAPVDSSGDDYINVVACLDTSLAAHDLLAALQDIEQAHGRERPYHNAPRTLDLDLLLHGNARRATPQLILPHPRLHLRAFVLQPLLEIAPDLAVPGLGALAAWLPATAGQSVAKLGALQA